MPTEGIQPLLGIPTQRDYKHMHEIFHNELNKLLTRWNQILGRQITKLYSKSEITFQPNIWKLSDSNLILLHT